MSTCPKCGSTRVAYFRLDADWGTGGDLSRLNPDEEYEPDDPQDRTDTDISGVVCFACGGMS